MARIRTIKPSFFTDHVMAELPLSARLTYIGLWTHADDSGRAVDDPRLIKAALWPLDDKHTVKRVDTDLESLARAGRIVRYESDGRRYLAVVQWEKHQHINRPQESSLPPPDQPPITNPSVNGHGAHTNGSHQEGKGREGKGSGVSSVSDSRGDAAPVGPPHRMGAGPMSAETRNSLLNGGKGGRG